MDTIIIDLGDALQGVYDILDDDEAAAAVPEALDILKTALDDLSAYKKEPATNCTRCRVAAARLDVLRLRGGADARELAKVRSYLEGGERLW